MMRQLSALLLLGGALYAQPAVFDSLKAPSDAPLTADPKSRFWRDVKGIQFETDFYGKPVPNHRTEVRSRWTPTHLYLLYTCDYDELTLKSSPSTTAETNQLWNWDVAEAFLGSDFNDITRYKEFQVSPQGEWVDLDIDKSGKKRGGGVDWNSGFEVKARVDQAAKKWYGEMKIPFKALGVDAAAGREIRAGMFRCAGAGEHRKYVSWQPTGSRSFHVPEKFGILRLTSSK